MPSSTAGNKAKGRRLQQAVRDLMLSLSSWLTPDDIVSRPMGSQGEDIMLSPAARKHWPLSIECKNQERVNLWAAWSQCKANAPAETVATLILKKNGAKPLAVVDMELFLRMVHELSSRH